MRTHRAWLPECCYNRCFTIGGHLHVCHATDVFRVFRVAARVFRLPFPEQEHGTVGLVTCRNGTYTFFCVLCVGDDATFGMGYTLHTSRSVAKQLPKLIAVTSRRFSAYLITMTKTNFCRACMIALSLPSRLHAGGCNTPLLVVRPPTAG